MAKRFYSVAKDVLTEAHRAELVDGIVHAPYFGPSVLGQEFVKTDGFSLVFQRSSIDTVIQGFPYLWPLLQVALFDECNAFYVNPLVLYSQSAVEAHVDCRLTEQGVRVIPNLVSVYYAQVDPSMVGGRIVFHPGTEDEVRLLPKTGDLLHFLGTTIHRVEPVAVGGSRISVVCEQYNLPCEQLQTFPLCEVLTGHDTLARTNALVT
jgi:hypothetical protein